MTPFVSDPDFTLYNGDVRDVLAGLPAESVDCCVTSPPYYGLRDYGAEGQLGLEATPEEYVARMVDAFGEVRRVLRPGGTCWLNIGDSYAASAVGSFNGGGFTDKSALTGGRDLSGVQTSGQMDKLKASGLKPKDLIGVPWMLAFALRSAGWFLRSEIIWFKPNPMPESVTDRPTKAHEQLFLLSKSRTYFYDADAIRESAEWAAWGAQTLKKQSDDPRVRGSNVRFKTYGRNELREQGKRNKRSVWEIATESYPEAHFATFPQALVEPCILAGCPAGGTVLDPFMGSGTTALVARRHGRKSIGIELNESYCALAAKRLGQQSLLADLEATA